MVNRQRCGRWTGILLAILAGNLVAPSLWWLFRHFVYVYRIDVASPFLAGLLLGPIIGQFLILELWCGLKPLGVWERLTTSMLAGYFLVTVFFASGYLIAPEWIGWAQAEFACFYLPLWLFSLGIAPGIMRVLRGWRIIVVEDGTPPKVPWTIAHLLALLGYFGLALGLASRQANSASIAPLILSCMLGLVWGGCCGLPCAVVGLGNQRLMWKLFVLVAGTLCSLALGAGLLVKFADVGKLPSLIAFLGALTGTLLAVLLAGFFTIRAFGFILQTKNP